MACLAEHPYGSGRFAPAAAVPLRPGGLELTRRAACYAGFAAGQRIVDLGCGEGQGTGVLCALGCRVLGVDPAYASLARAVATLPGLQAIAARADRLPIADASCDGIIAECALSLVEARGAALAECRRVLRPHGRLAICDVYARQPAPGATVMADCLSGVSTRAEIVAELASAGFRVERWEDHSAVLKTFMARLILASDSAGGLWRSADEGLTAALRARRPGYYLLIAGPAGKDEHDGQ